MRVGGAGIIRCNSEFDSYTVKHNESYVLSFQVVQLFHVFIFKRDSAQLKRKR